MIEDKEIAKEIVDVLNDSANTLNESIRLVQENCSEDEFAEYRKAAGFVMGYIYTEVLAPLYKKHQYLAPPDLREENLDKPES